MMPDQLQRRLLKSPYRENAQRLLNDPAFPDLWDSLLIAPRLDERANPEHLAWEIIHAAAMPASLFIATHPPTAKTRAQVEQLDHAARSLKGKLQNKEVADLLQSRCDDSTDFAMTGRHYRVSDLLASLQADLDLLASFCALPDPAKHPGSVQPRKAKAARSHATTKAALLKREMAKVYVSPSAARWGMYSIAAELANITEQPDNPLSENDARMA